MASSTVTPTLYNNGLDQTMTRMIAHGTLALAAGTYVTGGFLPTNWVAIPDPGGALVLIPTQSTKPDTLWLESISGSGYVYGYNKATGKVQIFVQGAAAGDALAEMANAAAVPNTDVIEFEAQFLRA